MPTTAQQSRAHIAALSSWDDTNDFRTVDLVAEILNVLPDRLRVDADGGIAIDGVLIDDARLIDIASRLPG